MTCIQVATAINSEQLKLHNTHQQRNKFALKISQQFHRAIQ